MSKRSAQRKGSDANHAISPRRGASSGTLSHFLDSCVPSQLPSPLHFCFFHPFLSRLESIPYFSVPISISCPSSVRSADTYAPSIISSVISSLALPADDIILYYYIIRSGVHQERLHQKTKQHPRTHVLQKSGHNGTSG